MSSISIAGDTSGSVILTVPAAAGSSTITLPAGTGTAAVQGVSTNIVSGTAVASTSGTSITFTGIPSWAKRITIMFSGVSTNGTNNLNIQVGSGSLSSSGYVSRATFFGGSTLGGGNNTTSFIVGVYSAAATMSGSFILNLVSSNTWVGTGYFADSANNASLAGGVTPALSGALDRVAILTNGTEVFDAGTINIMYE